VTPAVKAGRRIVIYGDYDVDGMTGTATLWLCLKLLGADANYYIPSRIDEGYGLNCDAVRSLAADKAEMIITVDCGIGSCEEAELARQLGVELIVTDLNMPNLDGIGLIREVRSQGAHRFTPILMLTTESDPARKAAGQDAGATGWVVKPFEPEQLIKVIKRVLPG